MIRDQIIPIACYVLGFIGGYLACDIMKASILRAWGEIRSKSNDKKIVGWVRDQLNERGKNYGLFFTVEPEIYYDGFWNQIIIFSNSTKDNSVAEHQIISDVESEAEDKFNKIDIYLNVTR